MPSDAESLSRLLEAIEEDGGEPDFHPHPLTLDGAEAVTVESQDVYLVGVDGTRVVAYGMLRGWRDGFEIPSLGIAVHPEARRQGFGRAMMLALHAAARDRGAVRIRLRVREGNGAAIALYSSLGYRFGGTDRGQVVGILDLADPSLGAQTAE